jgi:NAD(P)-dependent dehydrogenase (short-subunit alcohol dehydrogenase family)
MAGSTHHEEPTARAMHGQVCLIVGAGEGIGRACAEAFVGEGARVVLVARDANRLTNLAAQIRASTGSQAVTIAADLATPNVGRRVVDAAMAGFGRIDSVIAVATMAGRAALVDLDMDLLRQTFEVNVIGTLDVSRCAARVMTDAGRGGAIVHVSTLGTHSLPEKQSPYTATKAAMVSASMTMAKELGPAGIRVNVVTPGYVTGAPLDQLCEHVAGNEGIEPGAVSERLASTAALRRHVDPSDLAQAALFLAGPTGRNITGVELRVDAGHSSPG